MFKIKNSLGISSLALLRKYDSTSVMGGSTEADGVKTGEHVEGYAALTNDHVCGFQKESRMRFTNATKLDRKSGGSPPKFLMFDSRGSP